MDAQKHSRPLNEIDQMPKAKAAGDFPAVRIAARGAPETSAASVSSEFGQLRVRLLLESSA
jgi:hypothetical protein